MSFSKKGLLFILTIGLGLFLVSSLSLNPFPPARITRIISILILFNFLQINIH